MKKLLIVLFISISGLCFAQPEMVDGVNKYSTKGIHESDIMYQKYIWRSVDLREKQNQPIFSKSKEITRVIIEAVKEGLVTPYLNDSLEESSIVTKEEFMKAIEIPSMEAEVSEEDLAFMENEDDDWGDEGDEEGEDAAPVVKGADLFFPKDLYQLQIKENLVFDKQRSVMYHDILAITMLVPADHPDNIKGIELPIASFSYKELQEKVFRDNPNAIWYNPYNDAEHKSLADAFELRLFSSYIIKISNPNDDYLVDIYGGEPKTGIMASQWKEFELLEFEHNLWEF